MERGLEIVKKKKKLFLRLLKILHYPMQSVTVLQGHFLSFQFLHRVFRFTT